MSPKQLPLTAISSFAMGGAAAFFCMAMPDGLFEALVLGSGLPELLSAAQPPLGMTARLLFAGAVGGGAALVTALALVILGSSPRRTARPRHVPPERKETYPESWPRRPLSMDTDIGQPSQEPKTVPLPVEPEPEPEIEAHFDVPEAEWREIEPEVLPAEPEAVVEPAPAFREDPDPVAPPPIMAPDEDDPISALMERLDAAIERKLRLAEVGAPAQADPPSTVQSEEDHIRATLAELQRLASRSR